MMAIFVRKSRSPRLHDSAIRNRHMQVAELIITYNSWGAGSRLKQIPPLYNMLNNKTGRTRPLSSQGRETDEKSAACRAVGRFRGACFRSGKDLRAQDF